MDISVIINQMIVLFAMMALGYIAGKTKVLTRDGGKILSKVIINVAHPCLVLYSVMSGDLNVTGSKIIIYILLVTLIYAISLVIAFPVSRLLCMKSTSAKADRNLYCYMCMFSNVMYLGLPVCLAIFGVETAFYVALFSMVFNVLNFSLGVYLVSGKSTRFDPKKLINPPFISALISIPIALFGFTAPGIIMDITGITGNMVVPGVMIVTGSTLAHMPLKSVFSEWRIYAMTFVRLIFVPFVVWLLFKNFITDELILGVLIILSGTPVAMSATMITIEYKGNEDVASSGVFITTLLSIITIPLLVFLFLM